MKSSLVSIIVPAYKHEKFILDCLQSLHSQTHSRIEIVLIDDCSPDRTYDYASALMRTPFGSRFENVIMRRQAHNQGAHTSLNLGLDLASGDYIAIVNSDDLFRPRRIEALLEAMDSSGSELAFSSVDAFEGADEGGPSRVSEGAGAELPSGLLLLNLCQQLDIARERSIGYALLRKNVAVSTGNFLFSRKLAEKVGGFQSLKYCHDWDFILQSLLYSEPVYVRDTLYDYRLHRANSFLSLQDLAGIETETVIRRFFRSAIEGIISNKLCPSPRLQPGYFEAFVTSAGYEGFWRLENHIQIAGQRTHQQRPSRKESRSGFERIREQS